MATHESHGSQLLSAAAQGEEEEEEEKREIKHSDELRSSLSIHKSSKSMPGSERWSPLKEDRGLCSELSLWMETEQWRSEEE